RRKAHHLFLSRRERVLSQGEGLQGFLLPLKAPHPALSQEERGLQTESITAVYLTAFNRWKCVERPPPMPRDCQSATTLGFTTTSLWNQRSGMSANSSKRWSPIALARRCRSSSLTAWERAR